MYETARKGTSFLGKEARGGGARFRAWQMPVTVEPASLAVHAYGLAGEPYRDRKQPQPVPFPPPFVDYLFPAPRRHLILGL